jgi:hypothetical protein
VKVVVEEEGLCVLVVATKMDSVRQTVVAKSGFQKVELVAQEVT